MIDYNLITSIVAIFIALIALIVSYKATRYQIISLLNAQLADKAKDCNSNLNRNDLSKIPTKNDKVSWIVSSIITAEEIINYQVDHKKSFFMIRYNIQSLIDQFYLQLHTTIRVFLQKGHFDPEDLADYTQFGAIKNQYNRSTEFLSISINKDKNKEFEKLHNHTLERNKKK
ncbi:MAG: hypothetical protein WCS51_04890 [Bacilli bacterium]